MTNNESNFQELGEGLTASPRDPAEIKNLSDRLGKMIDYAIKRHDWYDEQRNKALSLGLALLGLSSFLVGGLLGQSVEHLAYFRAFAALTLISIVITAVWIILEFGRGSSLTYTHRAVADIRSWYFAYTIRNEGGVDPAIYDVNKDEENRKSLLANWEQFLEKWNSYRIKKNGFIVEDLQQVFVLFLLQNIKRNSLRKMLQPAYVGGMIISVFLAITIICAAFRI